MRTPAPEHNNSPLFTMQSNEAFHPKTRIDFGRFNLAASFSCFSLALFLVDF
jgi:hypothetical protein